MPSNGRWDLIHSLKVNLLTSKLKVPVGLSWHWLTVPTGPAVNNVILGFIMGNIVIPRTYGKKPERANIAPGTGLLGQSGEKIGILKELQEILKPHFALFNLIQQLSF